MNDDASLDEPFVPVVGELYWVNTQILPYVARWASGSVELVKETVERVVGCAKQILERLVVASDGVDI